MKKLHLNRRDILAALIGSTATGALQAQGSPRPALPPEAFGSLPAIAELTPSPQGRRLALLASGAGQRRVLVRNLDEASWLVRLDIGDMKLRSLWWASDDLLVAMLTQTTNFGSNYDFERETRNLFVVDCRDGRVHWPLRGGSHIEALMEICLVQQRGERVVLLAQVVGAQRLSDGRLVPDNRPANLLEFDLPSGASRLLRAGEFEVGKLVMAPDGSVLAHSRRDVGARRWAVHAGGTEGKPLLDLADPDAQHALLGVGRSPQTVLYQRPNAQGDPEYVELSLQDPTRQEVLRAPQHIQHPIFDRLETRLIGLHTGLRQDGWPLYFDARMNARAQGVKAALADGQLRWGAASDDVGVVSFISEGPGDAGTCWLAQVGTGKAEPLGERYPALGAGDVGPWRWWKHAAGDGLEIEGVLTLPPTARAGRHPLVLLPHGGPAAHDVLGFDWWAQAYAHLGYAVWQPNYRGSTGYGEIFRRKGFGQIGRRMQTDLSDGVAALAAAGIVDATRVAFVGASYGGYAALAGVTLQQGLYRCAVAVAAVADWQLLGERVARRSGLLGRRHIENYLGHSLRDSAALRPLSPLAQAAQADAPVLLIHGRDDTVVAIEHSRRMARALRDAGKPVELIELAGEDHWLSLASTRVAMLKQALGFVQKHNPA